jgi:hypothetical protein
MVRSRLAATRTSRSPTLGEVMAGTADTLSKKDQSACTPQGKERRPARGGLVTLPDRRGDDPARGGHGASLWPFTVISSGLRITSRASVLPTWAKVGTRAGEPPRAAR